MLFNSVPLVLALGLTTFTVASPFDLANLRIIEVEAPSTPQPYAPSGGLATKNPEYIVKSPFDIASMNLVVLQELSELALFAHGLAAYTPAQFAEIGMGAADLELIDFMRMQEIGHAQLIQNILQRPYGGVESSLIQCQFAFPDKNVKEFVAFSQMLTRFGESGVYGFLNHLDSRPAAQLLTQSITTEARQQMVFRQFQGLLAMPVWFESSISQSMAWTLLSPYIVSCPASTPKIAFENFPTLTIVNNPVTNSTAAINTVLAPLTKAGRQIDLAWNAPGEVTGYNSSYITTSQTNGTATHCAFISQLNVTIVPVTSYANNSNKFTSSCLQPDYQVLPGQAVESGINGSMFLMLLDSNVQNVTMYTISDLNAHVVAGPAVYQSG